MEPITAKWKEPIVSCNLQNNTVMQIETSTCTAVTQDERLWKTNALGYLFPHSGTRKDMDRSAFNSGGTVTIWKPSQFKTTVASSFAETNNRNVQFVHKRWKNDCALFWLLLLEDEGQTCHDGCNPKIKLLCSYTELNEINPLTCIQDKNYWIISLFPQFKNCGGGASSGSCCRAIPGRVHCESKNPHIHVNQCCSTFPASGLQHAILHRRNCRTISVDGLGRCAPPFTLASRFYYNVWESLHRPVFNGF